MWLFVNVEFKALSKMKNKKYNIRENIMMLRSIYMQPAFLICVVILAVAASSMSVAIKSFGVYLKKEALPLKKSLELLDENDLTPFKIVSKHKIDNKEIIKALGTQDYIQWIIEDTSENKD